MGLEAGRGEVRSLKVEEPFNGTRQRRDGGEVKDGEGNCPSE